MSRLIGTGWSPETVTAWATVAIFLAAGVQAATAVCIARLTKALAGATKQYAADTKRMVREMIRDREHQAAQRLLRVTRNAQRAIDPSAGQRSLSKAHDLIAEEYELGIPVLRDSELRSRLEAVQHFLYQAGTAPSDSIVPPQVILRAGEVVKHARICLQGFLLDIELPAREVPHYQRAHDWVTAPADAKLRDYLTDE